MASSNSHGAGGATHQLWTLSHLRNEVLLLALVASAQFVVYRDFEQEDWMPLALRSVALYFVVRVCALLAQSALAYDTRGVVAPTAAIAMGVGALYVTLVERPSVTVVTRFLAGYGLRTEWSHFIVNVFPAVRRDYMVAAFIGSVACIVLVASEVAMAPVRACARAFRLRPKPGESVYADTTATTSSGGSDAGGGGAASRSGDQ